jgi:SprT-like protein
MYTLNQLEKYASKFLRDNYQLQMSIPLELNGRMKRTCGWFKSVRYRDGRSPKAVKIELNKFFVENNDPITVLDVLRHELVHYALFQQGKPNKDGHPVFEAELKRLGIISQSTINNYVIVSKPVKKNVYQCATETCGRTYETARALSNGGRFHSCKCGGGLINKGKKVVSN